MLFFTHRFLGGASVKSSFGPNQFFLKLTGEIAQGVATDTWYIIAKADAEGVVKEISESNNTYGRSIKIGAN
jgi:hypothetical protein